MNVLILGATGQLGRALSLNPSPGLNVTALGREQCDLREPSAFVRALESVRPGVVINAAAYTAVDLAEQERDRAFEINATGVQSLARACNERGLRLVHVSTDFVFDGSIGRPYRPDDATNPLGVYGASKLAGERHIAAEQGLDWRIVRTSWVYSATGRNFMLTMLRLFGEREVVNVVSDQIGAPTSAHSLAECVWRTAQSEGDSRIMHFSDAGAASWYDFAVAIHEEAASLGLVGKAVRVAPIATDQYPTPARRPSYSLLDTRSTLAQLGLTPCHWRVRLREVLKELAA